MSRELIEGVNRIADALWGIADALTPRGAGHAPGRDAMGGYVASVTEALMGVTAATKATAKAIEEKSEE